MVPKSLNYKKLPRETHVATIALTILSLATFRRKIRFGRELTTDGGVKNSKMPGDQPAGHSSD